MPVTTMKRLGILALSLFLALPAVAVLASEPEQFFASIFYDEKKIGTFHVRVSRGDDDEIEEVRARASVSVLGITLYEFTQDVTHTWRGGEFEGLKGKVDNNGTTYDTELQRSANGLDGSVNGEAVSLPASAFPNSLWHYGVIDHTPLFDETTLKVLDTSVAVSNDTVEVDGQQIATTKATFTGDIDVTVWFDQDEDFIKGTMDLDGRTLTVVRDPES